MKILLQNTIGAETTTKHTARTQADVCEFNEWKGERMHIYLNDMT